MAKTAPRHDHWIYSTTEPERQKLRLALLQSHKLFCRAFLQELEDIQLEEIPYIDLLCNLADDIIFGRRINAMCWMPPGYGKTMILSIMLAARGFAVNPNARIMHISYSDDLVKDNSSKIRDIIHCDLFQALWPMSFREDTKSKGLWRLSEGGEFKAVSTAGQITGFRAGRLGEGYTGHMSIDDPIKPDDVYSPAKRANINGLFKSTVPSRLMTNNTPVLLVMQRLHSEDTASYLAEGNFRGFKWDVLSIPAINDGSQPKKPRGYTHVRKMIPYKIKKGALWPGKETKADLLKIKNAELEGNADVLKKQGEYYFNSQYQQQPASIKDGMFKREWFGWYDDLPGKLSNCVIFVDTAQKDGETNDYSVFMLAGIASGPKNKRKLYVIDVWRGKWKLPLLIKNTEVYWDRYKQFQTESLRRKGATKILVEDKGHGTGLIQVLKEKNIPAVEIQRSTSKVQRAIPSIPYIEAGDVLLPSGPNELTRADWVNDFIDEIITFNELMTHPHDDQCDVLFDGVENLLQGSGVSIWTAMTGN